MTTAAFLAAQRLRGRSNLNYSTVSSAESPRAAMSGAWVVGVNS
jgi:hypothetical protein